MPAGDAAGALQRTMPDYEVQELGSLGGSYSVGTSVSLGANSAPEIYRLLPGLFAREDRPENYLQIGRSCSWRTHIKGEVAENRSSSQARLTAAAGNRFGPLGCIRGPCVSISPHEPSIGERSLSVQKRLVTRYAMGSAEAADENQRRVEGVFDELVATKPDNVSYIVLRLADDSFVHVSFHNHGDDEVNPIASTAAFAHFQHDHADRRQGGVDQQTAELVGAYITTID